MNGEIEKLQKLVGLFEERSEYHEDICRKLQYCDLDVARAFVAGMSQAYSEAALEALYAQADDVEEEASDGQ